MGFYEDLTKLIFQLSSNAQLISSSEYMYLQQMFEQSANVPAKTVKRLLPTMQVRTISQFLQ